MKQLIGVFITVLFSLSLSAFDEIKLMGHALGGRSIEKEDRILKKKSKLVEVDTPKAKKLLLEVKGVDYFLKSYHLCFQIEKRGQQGGLSIFLKDRFAINCKDSTSEQGSFMRYEGLTLEKKLEPYLTLKANLEWGEKSKLLTFSFPNIRKGKLVKVFFAPEVSQEKSYREKYYLKEKLCGGEKQLACKRGRLHIKGKEYLGCHKNSQEYFCQTGLNLFCESGHMLCL